VKHNSSFKKLANTGANIEVQETEETNLESKHSSFVCVSLLSIGTCTDSLVAYRYFLYRSLPVSTKNKLARSE
jgi:hypothetical protein